MEHVAKSYNQDDEKEITLLSGNIQDCCQCMHMQIDSRMNIVSKQGREERLEDRQARRKHGRKEGGKEGKKEGK